MVLKILNIFHLVINYIGKAATELKKYASAKCVSKLRLHSLIGA